MNENRFPSDPMQDLRDLQRTVSDNEATGGSPLLVASAGWVMRHRGSPPIPPSGDIHIYAQNGRLFIRSTVGEFAVIPVASADYVAPISLVDAGASYDSNAQLLLNQLKATINAILVALKLAGLMDSNP